MNQAGIGQQVVSFSTPTIWHPDPQVRLTLARLFNDGCAEAFTRYPGRFSLFATLPLPFVDLAIEEAERAYESLGAVGVSISTRVAGLQIDDPHFEPLYKYLNQRQGIVFFHPDGFSVPGLLADYAMEWSLGAPFLDMVVLTRLIYSGLLEAYPAVSWIVPHLGGTAPFLAGRLDAFWQSDPVLQARLPRPPSTYLRQPNLFVDTVTTQPSAFALSVALFGPGHLVYGSDFPFVTARHDLSAGIRLVHEADLTEPEIDLVLFGNIASKLR